MKRKTILTLCLALLTACCAAVFASCHKGSEPQKSPLAAPVITLADNVVSWAAVPNATAYDVAVNATVREVTATTYTLTETAPGAYTVMVTAKSSNAAFSASAKSNEVTYTVVAPEDAVLTGLTAASQPAKTRYFLDERAAAPDLDGLVLRASYSDRSERAVALADCTVGSVDMTTAGVKTISVSYTDGEVSKTLNLTITVTERTAAEIDGLRDCIGEFAEADASYEIADRAVQSVVALDGTLVAAKQESGKVTIGNDAFGAAYEKIFRIDYEDGTDEFVRAVRATYVETAQDFAAINQRLNGYYILKQSIDFANDYAASVQIGKAPLIAASEGYKIDAGGAGDSALQEGVPFTGTLDGNGYAIMNYRQATESYTKVEGYGRALFGSIGKTGTVRNLTLRNVSIHGGQDCAFVAALNLGTVQNVAIESTCSLYSNYNRAGIVNTNGGTITAVVSYVTEYQRNKTPYSALGASYEGDGAVQNVYIAAEKTEIAELAQADGWRYLEGAGMICANASYVSWGGVADLELPMGGTLVLSPICESETPLVYAFYGIDGASFVPGNEFTVTDGVLSFADFANTAATAGVRFTLLVRSIDWGYSDVLTVTVAPAVVVEYRTADGWALTRPEGMALDADFLAALDVTAVYSDGTETIVHPIKTQNYDPDLLGAQTVRFYLTEHDYLERTVTTTAKRVVSIKMSALPASTQYTVGDAFSLDGAKIAISYDNGTQTELDVTADMIDAADYDMDTAGTYDITVTYEGQTATFRIVVAGAALESIELAGAPAKDGYLLNGVIAADDLEGLTISASYADGSTADGIAVTPDMLTYDFSAAGMATVTVSYGEKTATYTVVVANYVTALGVQVESDTVVYSANAAPDWNAAFEATMADGTKLAVTDVTASAAAPGRRTINFGYTDANGIEVSATHEFEIWYEIGDAAEWNMLNTYLDGYFRLAKSIDFESSASLSKRIGTLPLLNRGDDGYAVDPTGVGAADGQIGVPFAGRFDGMGYMLLNFGFKTSGHQPADYAATLFAYLGEGAEIRNFTVRGGALRSWQNASGLCGLNRGLIENIVLERSLQIASQHGDATTVGAFASDNRGVIRNVVSYVTQAVKGADGSADRIDLGVAATNAGTVENAYVTADLSEIAELTAIDGWRFFAGAGTVYTNDDYVKITQTALTLPLGGKLALNVAFVNGDKINHAIYGANNTALTVKWLDGAHTLTFADDYSAVAVGDTFVIASYVAGWKTFDKITVTITAAIPVSAVVATRDIRTTQGVVPELAAIDLTVTKSDGSTVTAHPTEIKDLDVNTVGAQEVSFLYTESGVSATATVTVEEDVSEDPIPQTFTAEKTADAIAVPYADGWSKAGITKELLAGSVTLKTDGTALTDWSRVTFDLEGANGAQTVVFTYSYKGTILTAEVMLDVYYGVAAAEQLAAIDNDLTAWYLLTQNIDLAQSASAKGKTLGMTAAFTGVLDGNGYTVSNLFISTYEKNIGLFREIGVGGIVRNLGLTGSVTATGDMSAVGSIAAKNSGTIANCYSVVAVTANKNIGGIVYDNYGTIENCIFAGTLTETAPARQGGIAGVTRAVGSATNNLYISDTIGDLFGKEETQQSGNERVSTLAQLGADLRASFDAAIWDLSGETPALLPSCTLGA